MADRKVLVKYYPPDFDPDKLREKSRQYRHLLQKKKKSGGVKQMNVRFMFPFTMCCGTCGEFIYIGTKFNSRVERIPGEDYLGIAIWRFYARCPHCRAEIAFKTDPKNTEYVLEFGGTRTYDPRKDAELAAVFESIWSDDRSVLRLLSPFDTRVSSCAYGAAMTLKDQLEEEIATDSMRALEHKTYNTANELMALEQLDELRKISKRLLDRDSTLDDALEWLKQGGMSKEEKQAVEEKKKLEELDAADLEDFEKAKEEINQRRLNATLGGEGSNSESENSNTGLSSSKNSEQNDERPTSSSLSMNFKPSLLVKKRTLLHVANDVASKRSRTPVNEASIGISLVDQYDSRSEEDEEVT